MKRWLLAGAVAFAATFAVAQSAQVLDRGHVVVLVA